MESWRAASTRFQVWGSLCVRLNSSQPAGYRLADFVQQLVTLERMIRAFEPVHPPRRRYRRQGPLHQIAPAQRIARAVEAQYRHLDARQVCVAQLLRLARGMQRIREEQETVAGKAIGRQHRGDAPAHRAAADDEGLLAAHARD